MPGFELGISVLRDGDHYTESGRQFNFYAIKTHLTYKICRCKIYWVISSFYCPWRICGRQYWDSISDMNFLFSGWDCNASWTSVVILGSLRKINLLEFSKPLGVHFSDWIFELISFDVHKFNHLLPSSQNTLIVYSVKNSYHDLHYDFSSITILPHISVFMNAFQVSFRVDA